MDVLKILLFLVGLAALIAILLLAGLILWVFFPAIVGIVAGVALLVSGHDNLGILVIIGGLVLLWPWNVPNGDAWMDKALRIFKRR